MRLRPRSSKAAIIVVCILVGVLAATNTGATPTVRPYIASMPPVKQTVAALGQTKTAEFATTHPEAKIMPPTSTSGPSPQGIQHKYPNMSNPKLPIENEWYGAINGRAVALYAGYFATIHADGGVVPDQQQGYIAVAVAIGSVDKSTYGDYHEYLTPTKHGALEITAVNGTQVSLVAKDGTAFTFNLDTRAFS